MMDDLQQFASKFVDRIYLGEKHEKKQDIGYDENVFNAAEKAYYAGKQLYDALRQLAGADPQKFGKYDEFAAKKIKPLLDDFPGIIKAAKGGTDIEDDSEYEPGWDSEEGDFVDSEDEESEGDEDFDFGDEGDESEEDEDDEGEDAPFPFGN